MAANYLGTTEAPLEDSPFASYTPSDWALKFIVTFGGIDGSHHKTWVLDQVARILNGTPVKVFRSNWGPSDDYPDGHIEWLFSTGEPSADYLKMVEEAKYDPETDDPEGYEWDEGIAP